MSKNPFLNALAASLYIVLVATVMTYVTSQPFPKEKIIAPIVVLSIFTLSAAVMGYIFGSQPLQMYFDGKKKEAVNLFLKTVGVFAGITALILFSFFSGIIS